jgi:5-(aminomethyl)-3-furanmethanol phosphate kinase
MWVAKLGGSLAGSERLREWLAALARRPGLVLVPGGGPFADAVRSAQKSLGFDDATAHHLAMLAMEQYGRALCALQPGLAPGASPEEIRNRLDSGLTPVWVPAPMVLADPGVHRGWDLTSDSLAAWLCGRLGAKALLLVKSCVLPSGHSCLETLARDGIVDPMLARTARAAGVPVHLVSAGDLASLSDLLDGPSREWPTGKASSFEMRRGAA